MVMEIVRSKEEFADLYNRAVEAADGGSKWPGMSFEEGVLATLRWLEEEEEVDPLEDE